MSSLRETCLELLQADTEEQVIACLTAAGYWDNNAYWRWLGDEEFNYSSVGNQQSRAEQAIVEKLVNAVDAKLMHAARLAGDLPPSGSEPQAPSVPQSIPAARQAYFGKELNDTEKLSRSITVASTGVRPKEGRGRPCFTIADDGEGQTPLNMPATLLSLHKGNKDKIKFAQGKFNMGGTGVLEFCGMHRNLQLVLSRRDPRLLPAQAPEGESNWSFTVIRREDPTGGKSSRFSYLAPVGAPDRPREGELLSFASDTMPIFPEKDKAYVRESGWGTAIKLYEYDARKFATGMMFEDGLMYRARLLLPEPALPIRFHECRGYKGHSGSFDTAMPGLIETLQKDIDSDRRSNVEWFDKLTFRVDGEEFSARIYLFKDKKSADSYKKDEGLIFTYNGQCHATMTKDFFRRRAVKQDCLWHSLLVFVDCSKIGVRAHEKLFMNSRDRLRDGELKASLEAELEDQLGHHQELQQLASERRKRELAQQPKTSESMAKVLENLLTKNPALAALLGQGARIRNPHKPEGAGATVAGFIGKRFPTYFRLRGHHGDAPLVREAHLNSHVRLAFETDAANEYFRREVEPGTFSVFTVKDGVRTELAEYQQPRLLNGIANVSLTLPKDASEGDVLTVETHADDPSRLEPFTSQLTLRVLAERETVPGKPGKRDANSDNDGEGKGKDAKGNDQTSNSQLDIPQPIEVKEADWGTQDPPFDKFTAMRLRAQPGADSENRYDYLLNVDNVYVQSYLKSYPKRAAEIALKFSVATTLVALSVLHQDGLRSKNVGQDEDMPPRESNVTDRVAQTTAAIAPFLLPMIESVAELQEEEEPASASAGAAA